ncbi:MAG: TetR/AcrR family transcriptional regulator [Nitrospiraceae bacterium]|jgi:AcrR family transcriptional regulator|nr:MAG: TetR/AcrR family transcriptional regulator [Nitrospiraceae bacterium]
MVQMNRRSGIKTKEKILDAAMKIFSTYGYSGANIRTIAKTAGISIGGMYLYFRNKEELYLDLIKTLIQEQAHKTKEVVASASSSTGALNAFISLHLEYGIKHRELIFIHIREHGFTFGMEIKRKFFRGQIKLLSTIIGEGIRNRDFRECNTDETARIIMATLRGVVLSMAIEGDTVVTEKGVQDLILRGLLKKAT